MKSKVRILFFMFILCVTNLSLAEETVSIKNVLAADTNRDGVISTETIKGGKDLILVKQNPSRISPTDALFQTTKYNLYVAANFDDLLVPNAFKTLYFGKIMSDGMIRIYTLANLGYTELDVETNSNDQKEVFLVDRKNNKSKIVTLPYQATMHKPYEEDKDKAKAKTKKST
jgi:hypothetical protein